MRRLLNTAVCIALVVFFPVSVFATSGTHFTSASQSINGSGQLVVNFSLVGLGNSGGNVAVSLTSNFTATWGCVNNGGNHPKATNKSTSSGSVSASGSFPVDSNGHASGNLTSTPAPSTNATCPGGMTLKLLSVAYSGTSLSADGATDHLPNISKNFSI